MFNFTKIILCYCLFFLLTLTAVNSDCKITEFALISDFNALQAKVDGT